ncbi:12150_t:CDS:2 [Ambispora gerdemannii]|uniref:12150_t:CDS:1 n=1 Tax=Ambispora gerdemannii TaxID=144530 RepID=A0A9N9DVR5_9GLOM|nr:12150_t:CDS:2 [Ambispora gerdemannii]
MEERTSQNSSKYCIVKICEGISTLRWKKITENVLNKAKANGTLASYYNNHKDESIIEDKNKELNSFFNEIEESACIERKSEVEKQELDRSLAYQCYLMCWNRNKTISLWNLNNELLVDEKFTWIDGVVVLTKLLYNREKKQNLPPIYSFQELRKEMEGKDCRLSIFFDSIYNATNPFEKSREYLEKLDKRLALECYLICGNRNSKLTAYKTEMSIFLNSMGTSYEAINAFANAGITITAQQLSKKAKIADLRKTMNSFKEVFITKRNDVNSNKERLLSLTTKMKVFLLQTYEKIYMNLGESKNIQTAKGEDQFYLAGLNIVVNKKQMPLGFSSERMPAINECDHCGKSLDVVILIACGHGYHKSCFVDSLHKKCHHCQAFLEKGIRQNVSSLITRLTKQDIKEGDLVEDNQECEDQEAEDQEARDLSPEDSILTQLEKDKNALDKVDEACDIALNKFLKAQRLIITQQDSFSSSLVSPENIYEYNDDKKL